MENTKYGRRREGRWTPIRARAQDTRSNLNSWETHLVRKRWVLSPGFMMMMMMNLSKVATQWLEVDSNLQPSGYKAQDIPLHHQSHTFHKSDPSKCLTI